MTERTDTGRRLDARLADWDARLDSLEEWNRRRATPVEAHVLAGEALTVRHILFVPSPSGYELVEFDGPLPSPGETVELPGRDGRYGVTKVVRSPLPGDRGTWAYLQLI